jgi:hypothetical protein
VDCIVAAVDATELNGLTLVVPDKPDIERDAVADAWERGGGTTLRLGRFWDPPPLDATRVRVYGNDTFCLVLQQKLGLDLLSPADDLVLQAPAEALRRIVATTALSGTAALRYPLFAKSVIPKQIRSAVYASPDELAAACSGLEPATELLVSDVVRFEAEARCFVLRGEVLDCAAYEGSIARDAVVAFVRRLSSQMPLPRSVVVDVGQLADGNLALVELNAAWGAGLNGCDAERVLPAIAEASAPAHIKS